MKFLFIVQGEGRGHLTQAITLEEILRRNGHEVVEIVALLSPAVEHGANALDGSGEDALAEVRLIKVDHCLTAGNRFSIFDDTHAGCCVNGSLCAIVEATGAGRLVFIAMALSSSRVSGSFAGAMGS